MINQTLPNVGNTPFKRFEVENQNQLIIKQEFLNPSGSWKDRGVIHKLKKLDEEGIHEFVIASSGNAAISFLTFAEYFSPKFKVHVVVSPNVNPKKLDIIEKLAKSHSHQIYKESKAKLKAVRIANQAGIPNVKSSLDADFLDGYQSLGHELFKLSKHNADRQKFIIMPVSSGTAFIGVANGLFAKIQQQESMPKFIACQTQSCHPLVEDSQTDTQKSLADSIVDKSLLRKDQILSVINKTGGSTFVISNTQLKQAEEFMKDKLELGYTSLLTVAAFLELQKKHQNSDFICIASGL